MGLDLTAPMDVCRYMSTATTEQMWNDRCDDVKKANGGYPSFWYEAVVLSGVAAKAQSSWK